MQNMADWTDKFQNYEDGSIGVAPEEDDSSDIQEPFDPTKIRVTRRSLTLDLILNRLRYDELDLSPDFQREKDIWTNIAQSRLIESLLIRIPIPAFYFDATDDDKWLVIDGVQRLTAFARFVMDEQTLTKLKLEKLKLCNLEFLTDFNDKTFDDLERIHQRRINETQVTAYTIDPGTPPDVKSNIFKRINTGGLPLSPQEIRHALNIGPATKLLVHLSKSEVFLKATDNSIQDKRRADQECILRFMAFTLSPYLEHKEQGFDFNRVLNDTMARMNKISSYELAELENKFTKAMEAAYKIFGTSAFRRTAYSNHISGALFEVWSVTLGQLSNEDISKLIEKKEYLVNAFQDLLMEPSFISAISKQARRIFSLNNRFSTVEKFIEGILQTEDPWKNIEDKYPTGKTVSGKVVRTVYFGHYLELEKGVQGIIDTSELSWTERRPIPKNFFSKGDEVHAVILAIDQENRLILLSYKETKPWEPVASAKYSVGSLVQGTIVRIVDFGAFVELEKGFTGLLHISELSLEYTEKVEDVVSIGQKVDLKVINLDMINRRIDLSLIIVCEAQPQ